MPEFKIEIKETLSKIVTMEGEDFHEARSKVKANYFSELYVLDSDDLVDTEFLRYEDEN